MAWLKTRLALNSQIFLPLPPPKCQDFFCAQFYLCLEIGSYVVVQTGLAVVPADPEAALNLKLWILLPPPPEYWCHRHAPPHQPSIYFKRRRFNDYYLWETSTPSQKQTTIKAHSSGKQGTRLRHPGLMWWWLLRVRTSMLPL